MQNLSFYAITNRGKIREKNEDNFYTDGLSPAEESSRQSECHKQGNINNSGGCVLFAVCDGLGGMNAGEVASGSIVDALMHQTEHISHMGAQDGAQYLDGFLSEQSEKIYAQSKYKTEQNGMGTTFVGLCISKSEAVVLNAGDSRCYLFREDKLIQLSTDHSEAERRVRMGLMSPEQARGSKERSMLYRYIGTPPEAGKMECFIHPKLESQNGDQFLLCSDGLTDMVEDHQIASILSSAATPQEAARRLIDTALQNGGKDNVTAVVVHVRDGIGNALGFRPHSKTTGSKIKLAWIISAVVIVTAALLILNKCMNRQGSINASAMTTNPISKTTSTLIITAATLTPKPQNQNIVFLDENLESAIRKQLRIDGPITKEDAIVVKVLDLSSSNISSIAGLESFTNLVFLNISNNNIRDIGALQELLKMEELHCAGNAISDLAPISSLEGLRRLDVSDNDIHEISMLSDLTYLTDLNLSMNRIKKMDTLKRLAHLEIFDCSFNYIIDIAALSNLIELRELRLNNNSINDISALSNLTNLTTLYIADNPISDFSLLSKIYPLLKDKDFELEN